MKSKNSKISIYAGSGIIDLFSKVHPKDSKSHCLSRSIERYMEIIDSFHFHLSDPEKVLLKTFFNHTTVNILTIRYLDKELERSDLIIDGCDNEDLILRIRNASIALRIAIIESLEEEMFDESN